MKYQERIINNKRYSMIYRHFNQEKPEERPKRIINFDILGDCDPIGE